MKKKNGCIYWDESSRGYHTNNSHTPYKRGRWVGERVENGRRVRMRSTDYNKVLAWLKAGEPERQNRLPLKGTGYTVDIEAGAVYGKQGVKLTGRIRSGVKSYCLTMNDGRKCASNYPRIAYAVLNKIDISKIPSDLVVIQKDGQYILKHSRDYISEMSRKRNAKAVATINSRLERRKQEIDILLRFYHTGDMNELTNYVMFDVYQSVLNSFVRNQRLSIQRATDVVCEGVEVFLNSVRKRSSPYSNITQNIISRCRDVMSRQRKQCNYIESKNNETH